MGDSVSLLTVETFISILHWVDSYSGFNCKIKKRLKTIVALGHIKFTIHTRLILHTMSTKYIVLHILFFRQKQMYEQEKNLRNVQLDALNYLWKEVRVSLV